MLSTKNVNAGGDNSLSKTIKPGNHTLRVNSIELVQWPFMEKEDAYYVVVNVETKPISGFEGFLINKDDESEGRYEGQIGKVKANKYYYRDTTLKSGTEISRDEEILKFIKNLCTETDCLNWFENDADGKFETIEEFVDGINKEKPFEGKWLECCVAGKEYYKKNGYLGYDMYFAKYSKGVKGFAKADANQNVHEFNESLHFEKAQEPETVDNFVSNSNDPFSAPEFDL